MNSYDEQISQSLEAIDQLHQGYNDLAKALEIINKSSNKTYGLSLRFVPKKGIYFIEEGWLKPLDSLPSIDDIIELKFIDKVEEKIKLKITYKSGEVFIID
ncbi:hypothetical protein BX659_13324 [Orenia metallireducens]|jgi:F0F1-type ATP synthase gamma subunit|uniref:Uncharacterized protein n=1 Tax=Orenia metallireducens TaxID=1413210 RepID=A0A285H750_9FIRM|nr:hypothetical protein [Orenia metallireducens]PRX21130.1 hypothetical protein BX659_13324 [Orenia metallireducens]SNY31578.1 hypothetical protein SAMN06265827_11523 [Orenia metallireducens]